MNFGELDDVLLARSSTRYLRCLLPRRRAVGQFTMYGPDEP